MIAFICGIISICCACYTIYINTSMRSEGYDLYKLDKDTVIILRHSYELYVASGEHRILSGVSKRECKNYAKLKGLKIK